MTGVRGTGKPGLRIGMCLVLLGLLPSPVIAASIVGSKHNLSAGGPGTVKAGTETEVCVFCHTPHNGTSEAPLWNRYSSGAVYIPYISTTVKSRPGQPTGASKLCLSCHDGTIALGAMRSRGAPVPMQGGVTVMPSGSTRLGTDLSDDHPVSFTFDAALASANGQLYDPSALTGPVRLDENRQLQCTACHDAHNNQYGKFLVKSNSASALCMTCHNKTGWGASIHKTSTKSWNGRSPDPWPHTEGTTVAANGCENCHTPHNAGTKPRLLNFAGNEQNCYPCHNGNVALYNVQAEFNKASLHPITTTSGAHDPTEDLVNPPRHVACADCHNPHAVNAANRLAGVKGVNASGVAVNPVTYPYELCFRCHADSLGRGPARVSRQFVQTNVRLAFAVSNASYHPIVAIGKSANVPSLISPWTTASRMTCTDCHNNSAGRQMGAAGPMGPHGSAYIPLLERRQELADFQMESSAIYALCYKCHSRASILGSQTFKDHDMHIRGQRTACTTCHDPHGVATVPRMINFNKTYVTPSSSGQLRFDAATRRCWLTCHGENHNPFSY